MVAISQVGVLERGSNVPITCNLTERGSQDTDLLDISLTKNGVLKHKVNVSDDPLNSTILLGPVVLENVGVDDGGAYACLLNVKLKNERPYKLTDSTLVRSRCILLIFVLCFVVVVVVFFFGGGARAMFLVVSRVWYMIAV